MKNQIVTIARLQMLVRASNKVYFIDKAIDETPIGNITRLNWLAVERDKASDRFWEVHTALCYYAASGFPVDGFGLEVA